MHARPLTRFFAATLLGLAVVACSSTTAPPTPAAPTPTAAQPADPNANPLAGTVLEGQGAAMQKARGVQDTLDQAAQARSDEIDEQAK